MIHIKRALVPFIIFMVMVAVSGCTKKVAPPPPSLMPKFNGIAGDEILRTTDGTHLFVWHWRPQGAPKALILLLHGTAMHGGVYEDVGKYLATYGYLVCAPDMRSWGQSVGVGSRGHVKSWDDYVSDLTMIIETMRERYPNQRIYGMGASLGAGVAMYGYLKGEFDFNGMILSGPAYKPNPKVLGIRWPRYFLKLPRYLAHHWGRVFPEWPQGPINLGIRATFKDPEAQRRVLDDPFVAHNFMPASFMYAMIKGNAFNIKNVEKLNIPLLLCHGTDDALVAVSSSREIYDRAGTSDKTLNIYPGMGHATLLETNRYQVFRDVLDWLNAHEQAARKTAPAVSNSSAGGTS